MEVKQTGAPDVQETENSPAVTTLLGTISYENREDYENFIKSLSLEHAAIVLISAANFAQSKGIFTLDEAELIANAIKRLTSKPAEPETPTLEPQAEEVK
jgi:hypothetical protein